VITFLNLCCAKVLSAVDLVFIWEYRVRNKIYLYDYIFLKSFILSLKLV
jgi:hypothetical protein